MFCTEVDGWNFDLKLSIETPVLSGSVEELP